MNTQVCGNCGKEKPETGFNWKDKTRGKRHTVCKECHKVYRRQHYLDNKEKYVAKARRWNDAHNDERRQKLRDYVYEYLLEHSCLDCGETNPVVLEFDHVRGKKMASVSNMVKNVTTLEKLKREIAKCEVRCANCHRIRTATEGGWWLAKRVAEDSDKTP